MNILKSGTQIDPFGRVGGKKKEHTLDEKRRAHFTQTAHYEIPLLVKVHKAWTIMLIKQGIIEKERGKTILSALNKVDSQAIKEMVNNWKPSGWEPMIQLESYLTKKIGQIASDVNIARTIPPPFYRLEIRPLIIDLISEILIFRKTLLEQAQEHVLTVMPGYTHLQHAQPMTFGHYLLGLYDAIDRASLQVEGAYSSLNRFDLGCGALSGTSFDIDRNLPAALLGFNGLVEHSNDGVAATDHAVDIVSALINIMIPLSRVANEFDIWSSFEFNMIEVADHIANPSSMMPQKKNPAIFEFCRMSLAQVLGMFSEVVCGSHGVPYGDVIEMRELTLRLDPVIRTVTEQLSVLREAIDTLIVKKEIMLKRAKEGFATVTELVAVLYRETNVPLRVAHGIVAEIVRRLLDANKLASDITVDIVSQAAEKITGNPIKIDKETLSAALDPTKFVEAHTSQGGVAPVEVKRMIRERKQQLEVSLIRHKEREEKLKKAEEQRERQVEQILTQP